MTGVRWTVADAAPAERIAPSERASATAGSTARRLRFWAAVAVIVIVGAIITLAVSDTASGGARLDPENPAPVGAMAVAEVLRGRGVEVTVVHTTADAIEAVDAGDPAGTTLVLHDPDAILDDGRLGRVVGIAATTVLLEPGFAELDAFTDGAVAPAGVASGLVDAACADATAQRAGSVDGDDSVYRVVDAGADAVACFTAPDDDAARLVLIDTSGGADGGGSAVEGEGTIEGEAAPSRVAVLGATTALTNEAAVKAGNGALVLGLLGEHARVIWLVPTIDEYADAASAPTIGELSPEWVVPFAVLALLVVVAAGIHRGRRFGPLVVEPLPVIVPASETMRGRARLYEQARARLRTADALRIGTVHRLAGALGLPAAADLDEVVAGSAARLGRSTGEVRDVLVGRIPSTDRDLVRLSDDLLRLERDLAVRISPTQPHHRADPTGE